MITAHTHMDIQVKQHANISVDCKPFTTHTLVSFFALKDKLWVLIKIKAFISIGVLIWKVQEVPSTAFSEKPEGGETHYNRKNKITSNL